MVRIKINTDTKTVELLEDTTIKGLGEIQKIIRNLDPKHYKEWTIEPTTITYYTSPYQNPPWTITSTGDISTTSGDTAMINDANQMKMNFEDEDISRN